eukprot:s471_g6.t1
MNFDPQPQPEHAPELSNVVMLKTCVGSSAASIRRSLGVASGSLDLRRKYRSRCLGATLMVQSVLAVASGKGGVGKSSVTKLKKPPGVVCVNLAYTMQKYMGLKVGILDTDIYGPSLPTMVPASVAEKVYGSDRGGILPLYFQGVPLMSMGFLRPGEHAPIRGPMASAMVKQMLTTTEWGELDFLLIDLPPGTGDIHLTVAQEAALDAAIVITTPQQLSLVDVEKGIRSLARLPFVLEDDASSIAEMVRNEYQRLAKEAQAAVHELEGAFRPSLRSEVAGALLILRSEEGEFAIAAREVLLECRSAKMRDEMTGKRLFREDEIPQNVTALETWIHHDLQELSSAGRYAMYIRWSNEHRSLFSFDHLKEMLVHRPDMFAVSWQGEGGLVLYSGSHRTKAMPRVVNSSSSSTISSLQWSYAYPQLLACAREDGDVEVWHFPDEGVNLAATATEPSSHWAPRGRAASCTALAMTPEADGWEFYLGYPLVN